jgi:hypothetical protein
VLASASLLLSRKGDLWALWDLAVVFIHTCPKESDPCDKATMLFQKVQGQVMMAFDTKTVMASQETGSSAECHTHHLHLLQVKRKKTSADNQKTMAEKK